MRTTVTLDADVAMRLRAIARERGIPFKAALNDAVRAGLAGGTNLAQPFTVHAKPLGIRPGVNVDKALALATKLEDDETLRKLDLRK